MSDSRNSQIPSIPKIDNSASEQPKVGSSRERTSQFGVKSSRDSLKPSQFGEQSPKYKPGDDDIEDEAGDFTFNKALLNQADIYQNDKWSDYSQIANSEEIALGLISSIINKGGQTLYDHYLDTKMDAHVLARTLFLSEFSWLQERLVPDRYYVFEGEDHPENETNSILRKTDRIVEDEEPKRAGCENWRSYNIEVSQKSQLNSKKDGLGQQETDAMSSRTFKRSSVIRKQKLPASGGVSPRNLRRGQSGVSSIVSSQFYPKDEEAEVINSYNKVVFQDYSSAVVDLNGQNEIDRVEEQLRLIKERERELKQQKAELDAMRLKEQKEQQQRMKQAQLGDSSKLYTFDFNGQIIAMNAIKMEKFPNQAIVMSHSISKAEIVQQDDTTESTQQKKKKKSQTNSMPTNDSTIPAVSSSKEAINTNNLSTKKLTQPSNIPSQNTQESSFGSPKAILTTNTTKTQASKLPQKYQQQFGSTLQSKDVFFSPPEEVFEKFTVTKGVTLIENGKMKKGPIFQSIANSIDVGRLTDLQYAKKLSLTKQEYNSLLNPPNRTLGRTSLIQKTTENDEVQESVTEKDETNQDHKDSFVSETASKSKNLLVGRKISDPSFLNKSITKSSSEKQLSFQNQIHSARYSANNQSGLDQYSGLFSSTPMRKKLLKPIEKDIINVKSIEILHSLASDDDSVLNILDRNPLGGSVSERKHSYSQQILSSRNQLGDQSNRSHKLNMQSSTASENSEIFDRIIPLTRPIDLFNNQIVNSGNVWGSYDSDVSSLRAPPLETHKSSEQFKEKCTVGQHGKFPRDRLMKKSKQLMSHVHLGSPPVGDTMGHGFVGDGFNPSNLVKVNQVLDEINAYQQHAGSVHQSDKTQHLVSKQSQGEPVLV